MNSGVKIPNIEVYSVPGKGFFIQEGHHRYVASILTGKTVGITYLDTGGPVGMPNWLRVSWLL